jgi:molybdopterin adenylyltransferase
VAASKMVLKNISAAVLTVSDSCFTGQRRDDSGPALCRAIEVSGAAVLARDTVADNKNAIARKLRYYSKSMKVDLVLSTGGTGLGPRDVTPEATRLVIKKEAPGLMELMRLTNFKKTRRAALSRGLAGVAGKTLVVNLPGSLRGATESWEAIADLVPHALAMIRGEGHQHK